MKELAPGPLWQSVLGDLQLQVPRPTYDTWLRDTIGISLEGHKLTVSVPSTFAAEWLERRMFQLISRTVYRITKQQIEVGFQVVTLESSTSSFAPSLRIRHRDSNLNQRYRFNSFVVGLSNRVAYDASIEVCKNPGKVYNPLFIYSGVGMGKTHLLHAMGHEFEAQGLTVLYVTSEQFTNEFITSLRHHSTDSFRGRYRSLDVLLIDDVNFMSGKEQTLETFFHTFNSLHTNGSQIIMTCDAPPHSMAKLGDRLRSRFEWGLVADIKPPSLETRKSIVHAKAAAQNFVLTDEVIDLIATSATKNIRELEGALNRIVVHSKSSRTPATVSMVQYLLRDPLHPSQAGRTPSSGQVLAAVAAQYGISGNLLTAHQRTRSIAHARQVSMYILREKLHLPFKSIATVLRLRNHTTVIYGVNKVRSQIQTDAELHQTVTRIMSALDITLPLSA